ncbi:hypothetical protein E2C01_069606 [Portunus trituberculatus]|uniref:Uncharacterized protein n=1 Tax=Portunus trituberculatus TaxID=210409 RepID=A0A5B7HUZ9_PORTR|nr:hypothetical protein [Portunus trituberculatus]
MRPLPQHRHSTPSHTRYASLTSLTSLPHNTSTLAITM